MMRDHNRHTAGTRLTTYVTSGPKAPAYEVHDPAPRKSGLRGRSPTSRSTSRSAGRSPSPARPASMDQPPPYEPVQSLKEEEERPNHNSGFQFGGLLTPAAANSTWERPWESNSRMTSLQSHDQQTSNNNVSLLDLDGKAFVICNAFRMVLPYDLLLAC